MTRRCTQLVYRDAVRAFTEQSKSLLTNDSYSRKWWSTAKTAVFGANSSLPPLLDSRGKLVWSAEGKACLLSAHFDAKHRRDSFQQQQACDPSPVLRPVAFRSSFICSMLLNLDSYDGSEPDGMFPLYYKQIARDLAPKVAVILCTLLEEVVFRHVGDWLMLFRCHSDSLPPMLITTCLSLLRLFCRRYLIRSWLGS